MCLVLRKTGYTRLSRSGVGAILSARGITVDVESAHLKKYQRRILNSLLRSAFNPCYKHAHVHVRIPPPVPRPLRIYVSRDANSMQPTVCATIKNIAADLFSVFLSADGNIRGLSRLN